MIEVIKLLKEIRRITHTPPTALISKIHQLSDKALSLLEGQPTIHFLCGARQAGKTKAMLESIKEIRPCKIEICEPPEKCPHCGELVKKKP